MRWTLWGLVGALAACDVGGLSLDEEPVTAAAVTDTQADRFIGEYSFAGGNKEREALTAAIEDLVSEINAIVRGTARKKLTATNPPFASVGIARKGDALTFTFDGRDKVCKLDGSATTVDALDGGTLECRLAIDGDTLVQRLDGGARGGRVNRFSVTEGGRLKMKVRIHSKLMPKDMRYTLTYKR
jgi:hypothetical protein